MVIKLVFNLVRVSIRKKRKIIKFIAFITICFWMLHRYCVKLTTCITEGNPQPCLNITNKTIDSSPDVNYWEKKIDLDWQTKNNVLNHIIRTGNLRTKKVFLTIGIPSIKRVTNSSYLFTTLNELESKTSVEDRQNVTCIIFLCDVDTDYNAKVEKTIKSTFPASLKSGFFQVVRVKPEFYPRLNGLKQNFKDVPERVTWRAKQVADFIFMFRYCSQLGTYHLQLEDDVSTVQGFVRSIGRYIHAVDFKENLRDFRKIVLSLQAKHPTNVSLHRAKVLLQELNENGHLGGSLGYVEPETKWTILEFSQLGFIGKLFRSRNLEELATFLAFYYEEQPVDWLIVYFLKNKGQSHKYFHIPALFQHFGLKSSFDHLKDNKLKDKAFNADDHESLLSQFAASKIEASMNPLALVTSNISGDMDLFYVPGHNHQLKVEELKTNQTVNFLFPVEQSISNVTVETGIGKNNCLKHASLHVGRKYNMELAKDGGIHCPDAKFVGTVDGCSQTFVLNESNVTCAALRIDSDVNDGVVFVNFLLFPL